MAKKIFGIASSSLGTVITGAVVDSADYGLGGDKKELAGNPPTSIVDVRMAKVVESLHIVAKFESTADANTIKQLMKDATTVTASVTSMDGDSVSCTGIITEFKKNAKKDDWWDAEFTVEGVDSGTTT